MGGCVPAIMELPQTCDHVFNATQSALQTHAAVRACVASVMMEARMPPVNE